MNDARAICTGLIIIGTSVFSFLGFKNRAVEEKNIFDPERILAWKEYHRLVTSGFLHAGWGHLILNMLSLYWLGGPIERSIGTEDFLLIYFGAIIGGNLLSLYVHRHHEYQAYGASGGVCGLLFAYILMFPGSRFPVYPIPFPVPGWLFALGFMVGSFFAMKAGNRGNIGHDAHLGGAIVGFLILAALQPEFVQANPRFFAGVLLGSIIVLVYLWINPMFLPVVARFRKRTKGGRIRSRVVEPRRENLAVDVVLDKIAKNGVESLTPEEKRLLGEVSKKYQRRAQSKKPESGLAI